MNCPDDNIKLIPHSKNDICVFDCPKCGGMWIPIRAVTVTRKDNTITFGRDEKKACPSCQVIMKEKICQGYSVSICEACAYIWIKGANLQALLSQPTAKLDNTKHQNGGGYSMADIIIDVLIFFPETAIGIAEASVKSLAHITEETGAAITDFFSDLFSSL